MRFAALAVLALLLGCGGGSKKVKKDPDYEGARKRAHEAFEGTDRGGQSATAASEPAPEFDGKAKNLGKDAVNNCTWLETEGLVRVGDQDSRSQARAAAMAEARKRAMESFLGVDLKQRGLDFQQEGLRDEDQLVESILQTTRRGRVIDEKVLKEGYMDVPGCPACRFRMTLRSCLVPLPTDSDHDFQVELSLSRTRFVDGDEARIKVTATRECYVYLYDVGVDGETSLVVPNEIVPEVRLKAGETFEYPDADARKRGVKLVAQLPEGKSVSAETIRLIATKVPLSKDRQSPAMGGYMGLLRRLNASRLDWTEDVQAFTIYNR
jgi:hypothetical protein